MTSRSKVWDGRIRCAHPRLLDGVLPVPCRHCPTCLAKRTEETCRRFSAEFDSAWGVASFVTLTYAPQFVPQDNSLSKAELHRFRDRMGKDLRAAGVQPRVFSCGEYGDEGGRPHYHLVVFGANDVVVRPCAERAWTQPRTGVPKGFVSVQAVDGKAGLFRYVTNYVTKVRQRDQVEGSLRLPEFMAWPSPMVGYKFAASACLALSDEVGRREVAALGQDVPKFFIERGRPVPMGQANTQWMRRELHLMGSFAQESRRELLDARIDQARKEFTRKFPSRTWVDVDAHVDQEGLDKAAARRRFYRGSKPSHSL